MKGLKINDKVRVISGAHKGKEAKIIAIYRKEGKAALEGVGTHERHLRKTYLNPTGGKKTIYWKIDFSNLKLVEAAEPVKPVKKAKKEDKKKKGAK